MDDLPTIGALIAAVIALSEAIKIGGKMMVEKFVKHPEDPMSSEIRNVVAATGEHAKLLIKTYDKLSKINETLVELHKWHAPEISPGVKVWWQRPEISREIETLSEQIASLDASFSILCTTVDSMSRDVDNVKTELHDLALRIKYRRNKYTSDGFEAVKVKK